MAKIKLTEKQLKTLVSIMKEDVEKTDVHIEDNKIVMYEPNTLIPIKLSNPNKMSIRNLRVKLFYQDYTEVLLDGLSVLTLLIM